MNGLVIKCSVRYDDVVSFRLCESWRLCDVCVNNVSECEGIE